MKRRDDETLLLTAIQSKSEDESVRSVIARLGIPPKRAEYILDKWDDKDWYEWGVCIDMGWLTEAGRTAT